MKRAFNLFKSIDNMVTETPVSSVMVTSIRTLKESNSIQDVVDMMATYSISGVMIVNDEGYPTGIVSEGDVLKKVFHLEKNPAKVKVMDVMSKHLFTIKPDLSIGETIQLMNKHKISKLPIVEDKKLVGYVTKSDLLEKMNVIYYQNTQLRWMPILFMVLLIIIVVLLAIMTGAPK